MATLGGLPGLGLREASRPWGGRPEALGCSSVVGG